MSIIILHMYVKWYDLIKQNWNVFLVCRILCSSQSILFTMCGLLRWLYWPCLHWLPAVCPGFCSKLQWWQILVSYPIRRNVCTTCLALYSWHSYSTWTFGHIFVLAAIYTAPHLSFSLLLLSLLLLSLLLLSLLLLSLLLLSLRI